METLPAQGSLTSTVATTIAYSCISYSAPTVHLTALFSQIGAIQLSHLG